MKPLQLAQQSLGYKESPSGSNSTKFGRWYGLDYAPWCAMAVSYWLYHAGIKVPAQTEKGFAYCPAGVQWFQDQGLWTSTAPQPGYVCFMGWDGSGEAEHVGLVEQVFADGRIQTIEGNTSLGNNSNGGEVMRRTRQPWEIIGYGIPPTGVAIAPPKPLPDNDGNGCPDWPGRHLHLSSPYMRGDDVRAWQQQMSDRGWPLEVDGIFGPHSSTLCTQFQKKMSLEADGVVGPVTWLAAWKQSLPLALQK